MRYKGVGRTLSRLRQWTGDPGDEFESCQCHIGMYERNWPLMML